jgi:hypothetical protein
MPRKIPQEEWDRRAAAVRIAWLAEVQKANTKCAARCLRCGREWEHVPAAAAAGQGCAACGAEASIRARRTPPEVWHKRAGAVVVDDHSAVNGLCGEGGCALSVGCAWRYNESQSQHRKKPQCRECDTSVTVKE